MTLRKPLKLLIAAFAVAIWSASTGFNSFAQTSGTQASSSEVQVAQVSSAVPGIHVIHSDHGPNSQEAVRQHYVVLVSLDGFRWDYAKKYGATHLLALGKQGVWAPEGMYPSYPSLTFPNHYAIATGLYPEHNGLVANSFLKETKEDEGQVSEGKVQASDSKVQASDGKIQAPEAKLPHYSIGDAKAVTDGSWYSGVPLWSLAEQQGMRSACLFWPGSEAKIAGELPTDYLKFDDKVDESARIDQVVAWLKEPAAERPHFITLYYSDVDHAGHEFGPDAAETRAAVARVDALIGALHSKLNQTGLPIDLVVISDHGMVKIEGPWVTLDQFADLSNFETAGSLLYGKTEEDRARVYNQLKKASEKFQVFRRKDVPAGLHYNDNPREGDPVIVPTGPYAIRAHAPANLPTGKVDSAPVGQHGFDPHTMPQMKATFFAAGPDIVAGKTVAPFDNVNLYPWIAHMLGLNAPESDGSLNVLAGTLRDNGDKGDKGDAAEFEPSSESSSESSKGHDQEQTTPKSAAQK